jgi:hypothetical protein
MVCPSFLVLFVFLQLDLVTTAITPWVVVVIAYLLSRHRLARGEALSSSAGSALNCHHNRQNWIVWFTKLEDPFFFVSIRSFQLLSDSCANSFKPKRPTWGCIK